MGDSEVKKRKLIKKQLEELNKREAKLLNKKESKLVKEKIQPLQEKIENKIPVQLEQTLEQAFEAGFKMVFKKATGMIEKSYNKEEKSISFDINHYAVLNQMDKKSLKKMDQAARKRMRFNQVMTAVEGGVLGAIGIGLPDIPLFIGMMLKNIYEVSLSYGFDYNQKSEKVYILYLICASVTKGEEQENYSRLLDEMQREKTEVEDDAYNLEVIIKEAAHQLSNAMLAGKFIQGVPLIGIVGGVYNFTIMKDINKMAQIKYKKRYLRKLSREKGRHEV